MNKKKKIKWVLTSSSLRAEFDGARLSPVAIGRLLRRRGLLLAMTIVIVFLFFAPGLTVLAQAPPLTKPALGVDIPGLDFGKNFADVAQKTEDGVLIPFLAQYISAAYRYLIGVSVIVAIIVVMYGGFLYMVGSAVSDVKRGKKYIFDAILGLVIILSAYLILQTVNPRLTELRGVIIPEAADDFDDYDKTTEEQPGGGPAPGATTEVDKLLQAYASCYNYDWRLLKAVSSIESGLRLHPPFTCGGPKPCQCGIHKKDKSKFNCYVGLFQFEAGGCQENTKSYPNSLNLNCGTVEQPNDDPETSTAAGSFRINKSLLQIQQACGSQNLTVEDTVFLLYAGHNLGPGVMRFMLSAKACKKDQQLEQVKKYVDTHADYKATLAEGGKYDPIARAERKWNYSQKAVDLLAGYGVTSLYPAGAKNDQTCPKVTGERAFKELKPNS